MTEPHTSVVISSEPLCRSTKSWELVPRNSMVIVEGANPSIVDASSTASGDSKEDGGVAVTAGCTGDGASDTCLRARSSGAAAAGDAAADGAATPSARGKAPGLGLVSSIRYEPLRCHASDAPAPDDPAFPDPASLPTSCARVRRCTSGSRGSCNGVGSSNKTFLAVKTAVN